jgi:hypothetical protein
MRSSVEISSLPDLLIIDTGPIRELVSYQAVASYGFHALRGDLLFLRNESAYEVCSQFIATFRRKMTSASVVAELYHWIRKTEARGHARLWHRVYEEFRLMGMDEEVVRLLELEEDLVARFGPIDGSLIELARRHISQKPLILTIDRGLHGECIKAGFRASLAADIVQGSIPGR